MRKRSHLGPLEVSSRHSRPSEDLGSRAVICATIWLGQQAATSRTKSAERMRSHALALPRWGGQVFSAVVADPSGDILFCHLFDGPVEPHRPIMSV